MLGLQRRLRRWVGIVVLLAGIVGMPLKAEALDASPEWKKMDEALTYLRGIPEVAWVKFNVHQPQVYISWKSRPQNFPRINRVAAQKAAHAVHNEVTVYALPPGVTLPEELWNYEPPFLCKIVANPQEIVESNCR